MQKNKGITLIAVIITIVMMLILLGITVTVIINSNILGSTKKASKKWQSESSNEAGNMQIEIDGETYTSMEEYTQLLQASLPGGTRLETATEYTVGGKTAQIPAGFTISGINSERTIDGGLVIYDIPKADLESAGEDFWTAKEKVGDANSSDCYTVQKNYNQFVWVPVETPAITATKLKELIDDTSKPEITDETKALNEIIKTENIYPMAVEYKTAEGKINYRGILYNFTAGTTGVSITAKAFSTAAIYSGTGQATYYREPAKLTSTAKNPDTNESYVDQEKEPSQESLQIEYNNIVESVVKQKGFWVARYELNYTTVESINKGGESKRGKTVLTASNPRSKQWYGLYATCQNMDLVSGAGMKSNMIYGSQWDQMMIWLKDVRNTRDASKYYILDSSNMGNYNVASGGTGVLKVSGYKDNYSAKQIFDLGGNFFDWTTEANTANARVLRGGSCFVNGSNDSTGFRIRNSSPTNASAECSARVSLYVTL